MTSLKFSLVHSCAMEETRASYDLLSESSWYVRVKTNMHKSKNRNSAADLFHLKGSLYVSFILQTLLSVTPTPFEKVFLRFCGNRLHFKCVMFSCLWSLGLNRRSHGETWHLRGDQMVGQVLIFAKTCNSVQAEEGEEHMLICHLPHLTFEKLNLQNFITDYCENLSKYTN